MNLIDRIQEAMLNDDDDREKNSVRLAEWFCQATPSERLAADEVVICLCGWTLTSLLIEGAKGNRSSDRD